MTEQQPHQTAFQLWRHHICLARDLQSRAEHLAAGSASTWMVTQNMNMALLHAQIAQAAAAAGGDHLLPWYIGDNDA